MIVLIYPNNLKKEYVKNVSYAKRGMDLEAFINEANKYYDVNNIALIYKNLLQLPLLKLHMNKTTS